jgi:hypothetical protein
LAASTTSETDVAAVVDAVDVDVADEVADALAVGVSWTEAAFALAYSAPKRAAVAAAKATAAFVLRRGDLR